MLQIETFQFENKDLYYLSPMVYYKQWVDDWNLSALEGYYEFIFQKNYIFIFNFNLFK